MTTFQRLIKYLAIGFGIFITVVMISAIVFTITAILRNNYRFRYICY